VRLPVAATAIIVGISGISGRVVPWRWSVVRGSAICIWVRRRVVPAIRIIKTTTTGRRIVINRRAATRRGTTITRTIIVIIAPSRRTPITVPVTARAVSAGWAATVIVVRIRSTSRRTRSTSIARCLRLGLNYISISSRRVGTDPYVCYACNARTLELTTVEFFYCGLQVGGSLKFNKASRGISFIQT
jgi:hypothetical protein